MRIGMRELVFFLVLAAMPLGAYFWPWNTPVAGLKRWNEQIAEAREQIKTKQQKLDRLATMQKRIEGLGQEIDKLSRAVKMFEKKLPAQRQSEVVLEKVTRLAKKHKLTSESFRPKDIVPAAHYAELPIRLKITGDFDGFYSFLLDVEKLPRITQIPTMQVEKLDDESTQGQARASMTLSIFFESAKQRESMQQASRS
jgi:type IV pilus assembly protein PilO